MEDLQMPLTNVQLELLKLYSTNLSEEDMEELRDILTDFYAKKSMQLADQVWDEKGLTDQDMDDWLRED